MQYKPLNELNADHINHGSEILSPLHCNIKPGHFRTSSDKNIKSFIYIPTHGLYQRDSFSINDIFLNLGIPKPSVLFRFSAADRPETWNFPLLNSKQSSNNSKAELNVESRLKYQQGIVLENAKVNSSK